MVCSKCGECCKYIFTTISKQLFSNDSLKYFKHRGIEVHQLEGFTMLKIPNRCSLLTDDNVCSVYSLRPNICRENPGDKLGIVRMPGCTDKKEGDLLWY